MVTKTLLKACFVFLITFMFSNAQAACICTCNPLDKRLCAQAYDIDNPCSNGCDAVAPGLMPTRTACPQVEVVHPITGLKVWQTICVE